MIAVLVSFLMALGSGRVREPQGREGAPETIAIVHGTVVPMDGERELARHTVLVQDGLSRGSVPTPRRKCPPARA